MPARPGNLRQSFEIAVLQNKVPLTTGNFSRRTPVRYLHVAFKIPHVYDLITELCR
jgi:hypothetical protein